MKHKGTFYSLLISVAIFIGSFVAIIAISESKYDVPGTVIGKNVEQYAHGKHNRNMSTRYVMAVRPFDQQKFKTYSVYTDFATYCSYNTGDKIQFNDLRESLVSKEYEEYIWTKLIAVILMGLSVTAILFLCLTYNDY